MARQTGFALISVLSGLVILSAIAAAMLSTGRVSSRLAAGAVTRAEIDALADAAVNRAVLGLLDRRADHRWRVDGVLRSNVFKEYPISVTIQDEYGKVDLNAATADMLRSMFRNSGVQPDMVDSLTDAVLDWREPGDLRRLRGAKAADYAAAGYDYGPRGGPFQTVDELKLVLGMPEDLFRRLQPILTVYSKRQALDVQTASRAALIASAGMGSAQADALIQARQSSDPSTAGAGPIVRGVIDPSIPIAGWPFALHVEGIIGQTRFSRDLVIRLTGDDKVPYWVLWRR
jgi:general secretion pathway protein K